MFVDRTKVYVKAGNGGNGCVSFHREKFVPKGGPDGGDGGNGSSVVFIADNSQMNLNDLRYNQHVDGKHGMQGMGARKHGKSADTVVVKVPIGTLIYDVDNDHYVVGDLDEEGKYLLVAKGGHGGKGNVHFASAKNRIPRKATPGAIGEERTLLLELKTVADVGLVGYPNAGKSTFINSVSKAGMKTAPYPFTTKHPSVGVIDFPDFTRLTIADIPGLVDGAHDNVGLGHYFLRHVERTKIIAYVLDMAGKDGRSPIDDLANLIEELDLYLPGLSDRGRVIIANKMDEEVAAENLIELRKHTDLPILTTIAEISEGTTEVVERLHALMQAQKAEEKVEVKAGPAPLRNVYQSAGLVTIVLNDDDSDFVEKEEEDEDSDIFDFSGQKGFGFDEDDDFGSDFDAEDFEDYDEELDLIDDKLNLPED